MLYNTTANFYPAQEPKNGYIGRADITVADAIRIRGIAVFEKADGTGLNLRFPTFGEKDVSYIYPVSKEAYADMLQVVGDAVKDEQYHFGHATGKYNPNLTVKGHLVEEPYADARFSIEVEGFCTLNGISTRQAQLKQHEGSFIAVDMPTLAPYENKEGKTVYPPVFEGLKSTYKTQGGEEKTKDFGVLINNLVRGERKKLLERKPELDDTMSKAAERSSQNTAGKEAVERDNRIPETVK